MNTNAMDLCFEERIPRIQGDTEMPLKGRTATRYQLLLNRNNEFLVHLATNKAPIWQDVMKV